MYCRLDSISNVQRSSGMTHEYFMKLSNSPLDTSLAFVIYNERISR